MIVSRATILNASDPLPSTRIGTMLARLDLFKFVPFRLNRLAAEVSSALAAEYQARYGLDIPEWRVLAARGFCKDPRRARYIAPCTPPPKSTLTPAGSAPLKTQMGRP